MASRSVDDLSDKQIAGILNDSVHDEECSDDEDGLEESDHDSESEIFGDDTDNDPDFVPDESDGSGDDESNNGDDEANNEDNDDQPVNNQDGHAVRVAERCILGRRNKYMIKKHILPFKWSLDPPPTARTRAHNIISKVPGAIGNARTKQPKTPLDSWRLFIDDDMIDEIIEHTNEKITELAGRYSAKNLNCHHHDHVDKVEMEAFLGLLYLAGVFKSNHEDISALFATDGTGRDIFRATMTKNRFLFLLTALRFDCIATRPERKENDPLAAISSIFNKLVENSKTNYSCGQYTAIDEMLVPFRGKFRFRVYMKNKPAKYGIKIFILADARTSYFVNGAIYCARQYPNPKKLLKPTLEVLNLVEPILNTNRNITADNWFSSVQLADELKERGLTFVGTMRKNKLEIPQSYLPNKNRLMCSTKFAYTKDKTLVSYVPKYNNAVILISSMHHEGTILEGREDRLPEVIDFYNITKVGVDSLDQKCAQFSVNRRTQRWPMTVWYAAMNIAGVNAHVILHAVNPQMNIMRRQFLVTLGRSLIENLLRRRMVMTNIPRELKSTIRRICNVEDEPRPPNNPGPAQPKRRRCHLCPRNRDQKHLTSCSKCYNGVCKAHCKQEVVCESCQD